jgi:hypothetical protein
MEFPAENSRHGGGDVPKLNDDGGKGHPKIPKSTVLADYEPVNNDLFKRYLPLPVMPWQ